MYNFYPYFEELGKKFWCKRCGWKDYTMHNFTDEHGSIKRGCPYCKTDKYIELEE